MPSTFSILLLFLSDANAIEKLLRLLQSLSQIAAVWDLSSPTAKLYWELRRQFALGRRYLRFFRFLDAFKKAWEGWERIDGAAGGAGLGELMLVGKWCFMGAYLGLESCTILDAMRIWPSAWAQTCLLEGNKFWFYSLVCSLVLGVLELSSPEPPLPPPKDRGKGRGKGDERKAMEAKRKKNRAAVKRKLVSDIADFFIPGLVTGWIPTNLAVAGWASAVSTVLGLGEVWEKCAAVT